MKSPARGFLAITAVCCAVPAYSQASTQEAALDAEHQPAPLLAAQQEMDATASRSNARAGDRKKSTSLEEVIVTAQKRRERIQDIPISIAVLNGDELDSSTVASLADELSRVPGVAFTPGAGRSTHLIVRGVQALAGATPIAFYVDSMPFGFTKQPIVPDPDVYDLDRVEVLRGPHGTLYGANALNGVVRVLTKDADPGAFELKARTSISTTDKGGENYRGDMVVNVPIVEGKLAARAAVGYQDVGGWIDKPNKKDANGGERRTMRLKINALPTDNLSIGLSAWSIRNDFGAESTGIDPWHSSVSGTEPVDGDNYDTYGLSIEYDFPAFSLASKTSYLKYDLASRTDIADVLLLDGYFYDQKLEADTFSQEVNLVSTHGGAWRWTAGGMYRDSDDKWFQDLPELIPAPISEKNTSQSFAVFGELTRLFGDGQWELTAGVRYFEDDVGFVETSRLDATPPDQLIRSDRKFSATTKRLALSWHATEQLTAYLSYGEGFRSGSEQNSETLSVAPDFPAVNPDELTNYEIGAKGSLLDGRLSFDTALYYIDWQDVQLFLVVPAPGLGFNVGATVNGESASGIGIDFSLATRPVERLSLGVNFGWNDVTADNNVLSGGRLLFRKGDRVGTTPEYSAGVSADYDFPVGVFKGQFSIGADYSSERTQYGTSPLIVVRNTFVGDSLWIGRASLSVRAPDHWTAALFVDNLNNEDGVLRPSSIPNRRVWVQPRTIGLQFEYAF